MRMERQQREALFFLLIMCTYVGLNMHVQVSMRGSETDREKINSCSCKWEKWIMQKRMKVRKEGTEDAG